jgi:hypothetical protein
MPPRDPELLLVERPRQSLRAAGVNGEGGCDLKFYRDCYKDVLPFSNFLPICNVVFGLCP